MFGVKETCDFQIVSAGGPELAGADLPIRSNEAVASQWKQADHSCVPACTDCHFFGVPVFEQLVTTI